MSGAIKSTPQVILQIRFIYPHDIFIHAIATKPSLQINEFRELKGDRIGNGTILRQTSSSILVQETNYLFPKKKIRQDFKDLDSFQRGKSWCCLDIDGQFCFRGLIIYFQSKTLLERLISNFIDGTFRVSSDNLDISVIN